MTKLHYNKLVRDRIPEIIQNTGKAFKTEIMELQEFEQALLEKLREESEELISSPQQERCKELADIYEVLEAIQSLWEIQDAEVLELKRTRANDRGAFMHRIKLLWVEER